MTSLVRFLNRPSIKEGVKNAASAAAFTFGLIDVYQISRGRKVSTKDNLGSDWVQAAARVALICARISLILSAAASRPGVFIISTILGQFFSAGQLERVFGPNTVFALNPWHPRHVVSIAATVLALPSVVCSIYQGIRWASTKRQDCWLSDQKVHLMAAFNTATGRPSQHLVNQLCRS